MLIYFFSGKCGYMKIVAIAQIRCDKQHTLLFLIEKRYIELTVLMSTVMVTTFVQVLRHLCLFFMLLHQNPELSNAN
jgi:hypothetical protein